MIRVEAPASLVDLAELCGAGTEIEWEVAREMHRGGQTMAFFDAAGNLLCLFGLYPLPADGAAEAWFNVAPCASRHMRAIIRRVRLTLPLTPYAEIEICCQTQAGRRIAASCGFTFVETIELGEIWKWDRCSQMTAQSSPERKLKPSSAAASPSLPSSKAKLTNPHPA